MRHYKLSKDQRAARGFTDLFVITADDATETTNQTSQAVVLDKVNLGDVIRNHTLMEIKTPFTPQLSADSSVLAQVGRTGPAYTDVGAAVLQAGGVARPVGTTTSGSESIADQVIAADDTDLVCYLANATDADGALSTLTAGELWIWMDINRSSERPPLGAA